MRVIIQRVTECSVHVGGTKISYINSGLLVLVGIVDSDGLEEVRWLSNKIVNLRIFDDDDKIPNISVKEIGGDILLVSQFTLHAFTKKGNRPGYSRASKTGIATPVYEAFIKQLENDLGKKITTGIFGADMQVALINDGPVTIFIDTQNKE